jgi:hypothetical protein
MATRSDLCDWVVDALRANGGRARLLEVCKRIWTNHKSELRQSGDLFYKWQYDVRWAAQLLRNQGVLKPLHGKSGPWELTR